MYTCMYKTNIQPNVALTHRYNFCYVCVQCKTHTHTYEHICIYECLNVHMYVIHLNTNNQNFVQAKIKFI